MATSKFEEWIIDLEKELGDSNYEKLIKEHLRTINQLYVFEVTKRLEGGIKYLEEQHKNGTFAQGVRKLRSILNSTTRLSDKEPLA